MVPSRDEVLGTILDDTGILTQGKHSVGVGRQYTGSAGKIANCQIAVTMAVYTARHAALADVGLCLPKDWTDDAARLAKAGVPADVVFRIKGEIALAMLKLRTSGFHRTRPRPPSAPNRGDRCGAPDVGRGAALGGLARGCRPVGRAGRT